MTDMGAGDERDGTSVEVRTEVVEHDVGGAECDLPGAPRPRRGRQRGLSGGRRGEAHVEVDGPVGGGARWQAVARTGETVALRYVPEEVRARLSRIRPVAGGAESEGASDLDAGRVGAERTVVDELMAAGVIEIRPLLVDIDDDVTNPVWWVSRSDGQGGIVTLSEALHALSGPERSAALRAHVELLGELSGHESAAASIADGVGVLPLCAACVAEPELHAAVLAESVAERGRELADAWMLYDVDVTVRGRRA